MAITIGLHMICRHETASLEAALESCKPVAFDQVVVGITSKAGWDGETRKIVERYGEAVDLTWLPKFDFGDYGECIASFAQARQQVYERLTTDWAFWIDADDELDAAEELRPLIERLAEQGFGCLMLNYFYGFDDNGNCITNLMRERAVKRSIGWQWVRRVHEGMMALGPCEFAKSADVIVMHRSPTGRGYPVRNLKLLMLDYDENPNDKRTICYIGHQYYAMQDWKNAALWYEKYVRVENQPIEKWQALHFLADCYRQIGQYQLSIQRDLEAAILIPTWADPYFGLAETFCRVENYDACIWWDKVGRVAQIPDSAIFTNYLDYSYNPALFSNIAYYHKGDLGKARQIIEEALKIAPRAEHLQEKKAIYDHIANLREQADGLLTFWRGAPNEVILNTPIPDPLLDVPDVKTRIARASFDARRTDSPWAVFFCGRTLEPWGPPSLNEGGIGGSETAVIHMARGLARRGWRVDVFNDCGKYAGMYDGAGFWPFQWYNPDFAPDLLVGWRQPGCQLADYKPQGKVKWLWCHDAHMGNALIPERAVAYDRIMGVSHWHSDYMKAYYPFLNNLNPTRNGIDLARFDQEVEKNPLKAIYASSPDRGLEALLVLWPKIVAVIPDAELHIYYGWQNIEKFPQMLQLKQRIERLMSVTPNVHWRGRLGQDELAREFLSAGAWLYPTEFLEVSCITAMECMAAGIAMLTSDCGALPETIGDRGILLSGFLNSPSYQKRFVGHAVSLLRNKGWQEEWAAAGKKASLQFAWDGIIEEWITDWEKAIKEK